MNTILCPQVADNFAKASTRDIFFGHPDEREQIDIHGARERPAIGDASEQCKTNLFFGFFFDGTRNNYEKDESSKDQSNVARLYDIYPGLSVDDVLPETTNWAYNSKQYQHFFRVYIPGVATPFKQVKDSGEGWAATFGGAGGRKGCDRIVWALIQAINNVNRYFHKRPLISDDEATKMSNRISLSREARRMMTQKISSSEQLERNSWSEPRIEFEGLLRRLHASVSLHWSRTGCLPPKVDPGIVKKIYISTFGFSRGATQARAFANWLDSLCQLDAMLRDSGTSSLGGFPVEFDFLGLFDSVASVGLGNTYGNFFITRFADGHGSWADAEDSLRIPASVKSCVHLVAGHELRRSFPCDSVSVGFNLPANAKEIVFPGVHSDVGGGYGPKQQGKGTDDNGKDMLSRVPLLYMYKQARLAGVPLKLELADSVVQRKFEIAEKTISDFNAYIGKCTKTSGRLTDIIREQAILQMGWRYWRREGGPAPLSQTGSFGNAKNFDKNDLISANLEFNKELGDFEKSIKERGKRLPERQEPGFKNTVVREWEEIATYWPLPKPDPVVAQFFDNYVHDSRSGFKLSGDDNEEKARKTLAKWSRQLRSAKERYQNMSLSEPNPSVQGPPNYGMNENERIAAEDFDAKGEIPRYIVEGREPYRFANAGYFRFRKVYGGSDNVLLSNWRPVGTDQSRMYAGTDPATSSEVDKPSPQAA